jgi:hypothetical protein
MKFEVAQLLTASRAADIVLDTFPISKQPRALTGKHAESVLQRFNELAPEKRVEFIRAACWLSSFANEVLDEAAAVEIDVPSDR